MSTTCEKLPLNMVVKYLSKKFHKNDYETTTAFVYLVMKNAITNKHAFCSFAAQSVTEPACQILVYTVDRYLLKYHSLFH